MSNRPLEFNIPANNEKIIEIYNKVKSGQLNPSPDFQRKLVWKRQHKYNFINTIIMNYPFPEIYKAPGQLNTETLQLEDLIVDGQQRITTIVNFIDNKDVFALSSNPIKFSDLSKEQKTSFLNYEISIRYLKNADKAQIKEIFQRINNTEYSLNRMERLNAQWGDSEFVCFAKQLIEQDLTIDTDLLEFKLSETERTHFLSFFHDKKIFSENDNNRMLSLQYMMTLIATLIKGEYFRRNDETQAYIELYNENFDVAPEITNQLLNVTSFIHSLNLNSTSYWFNKANIFTMIAELYKYDISKINIVALKAQLLNIEKSYTEFTTNLHASLDPKHLRFIEFAREAVNEKVARDFRGTMLKEILDLSSSDDGLSL